MKLTLSQDVKETLPAPDRNGVVRVSVGIKVSPEGEAELVEINDVPVPSSSDEPEEEESAELDAMAADMPSPESMAASLLG